MYSSIKTKKVFQLAAALMLWFILPLNAFSQQVIEIQVSPNVLNLQNQGQVVTIHTDIPFSQVVATSVSLNGVEIDHWKADAQGYFVAKFLIEEIKALPLEIGEMNTMTLDGTKTDGEAFTGSGDILVVNNIPSGKR